jgi:hypothetical protein
MGRFANAFGPDHPETTYISHSFPEQRFDTGEVEINYAVAGRGRGTAHAELVEALGGVLQRAAKRYPR